mmetsp:Transcript_26827/g.48218  ORF Transcript_26827/g.48218 Transcript_26827/m.48218 type:complete len:202 (+) Transcript_26827:227-832(+)
MAEASPKPRATIAAIRKGVAQVGSGLSFAFSVFDCRFSLLTSVWRTVPNSLRSSSRTTSDCRAGSLYFSPWWLYRSWARAIATLYTPAGPLASSVWTQAFASSGQALKYLADLISFGTKSDASGSGLVEEGGIRHGTRGQVLGSWSGKNAMPRHSMDWRRGALSGALGSEKLVWKQMRPGRHGSESHCLKMSISFRVICEK